ncbi:pyridoxamine 5'-phosphate oxidase family protein [Luteolibacter sp. GHJ8]|uniref:Pyridoxamine 5'-phosphate oxidase family protein n=1 Tax=Luteolibacter rhizosphaerae TaxID=2989719 RepID=A0ABT3GA60_9BACT|nr:pyridoxamine 5'-phosphate oxidase family protein [Luteolibacter rhizosphaerae]MCW1916737.1 pyridoxamine 5'-phosphate oxidase family protein [Luteolibacter rhizosphaerae]
MAQPKPEPVDPAQLPELALATMKAAKFPMLASDDAGQPRIRPVSPVKTERFTIWVANLRSYHKTGEIAANPRVELCYLDADHHQVRITGIAMIEDDPELLAAIWEKNPLLRSYLGTPDNPELLIYRIEPNRVRFMKEWALEYHEVRLT